MQAVFRQQRRLSRACHVNRISSGNFAGKVAAMVVATLIGISGIPAAADDVAPAPGEQRRWSLDFRVRLEQGGGEPPIEVRLSGDWVSTICAVRPGRYDVTLELANASFKDGGAKSDPADANEQLRRRLARPFWATYRKDGALLAVHFLKDVPPSDRNLLQTIVTEAQLVRADPDRPVWTMLERDGAGEYVAIYNRRDLNVVVKRKLKYVHTDGAAGAPAAGLEVNIQESELRFSLDPDGEITALDGSNRVRIGVAFGNAAPLAAVTETHLGNLRRSHAPEKIGSLARALSDVETSPVVSHKPDPEKLRAELDGRLIEGRTTESLLEAATAKGDEPMLRDRLAALFRQRPEATVAALALLLKNGPQKRITDAFGSAGSSAAIRALSSLASDRSLPRSLRIDALSAFIVMQRPSGEAMRLPATLLDDVDGRVASAARITSGALARAGRAEHPVEAEAIDAALVARYRRAREAGECSDLLAAMGNSVGPSVLPVIRDALRDLRNSVRAEAVGALRLAGGPEFDRLLSATITDDGDPGVRAAAIFASTFRHPFGAVIGESLVRAARTDSVDYVRSNAVTVLRQNPGAAPNTAEALAWIAEHDVKPGIRRLAREALASVSRKGAR
jgi:hypothetical protein